MKFEKIKEFGGNVGYCLRLSWQTSPLYTFLRIVSTVVPSMLAVVLSYIGKDILDVLTSGDSQLQRQRFVLLLGMILIVNISLVIMRNISQYVQVVHADILNAKLSQKIMEKTLGMDLEYFDNSEYYDALILATQNVHAIMETIWHILQMLATIVTVFIVLIILCLQNWLYGVISLVASVPAAMASIWYTKALYDLDVEQINNERKKAYIQAITPEKNYAVNLRLYDATSFLMKKYKDLWKLTFTKRKTALRTRGILTGMLNCLPEISMIIIALDIGKNIFLDRMTIGAYSLYTGLVGQLCGNFYSLTTSLVSVYDNQLKIQSIWKLDGFHNRILDEGEEELKDIQNIEFRDVCFSYPGTDVLVLKNICFSVEKGEHIALVGVNGSGKSTIIKLLLRFYEPDFGQIAINGRNICEYTLQSLRKAFSVYFQEEPNYCFSLRENITISDTEQPSDDLDERVCELLKRFAPDVLKKAAYGLDTQLMRSLSSDGMELSGGQHQKVALVRSFYRRHTCLVLDEPSASLDPEAEYRLFAALKKEAMTTTIFTSHRLSNTRLADRIIIIEHGEIVETGTHQDLLGKDSRYKQLFEYQNTRDF